MLALSAGPGRHPNPKCAVFAADWAGIPVGFWKTADRNKGKNSCFKQIKLESGRGGVGAGWWISSLLHVFLIGMSFLPAARPLIVARCRFTPLIAPARTRQSATPAGSAHPRQVIVPHLIAPKVLLIQRAMARPVIQLPQPPEMAVPALPALVPVPTPLRAVIPVVARQTSPESFLPAEPDKTVKPVRTATGERFDAAAVGARAPASKGASAAGFGDSSGGPAFLIPRPSGVGTTGGGFAAAQTAPVDARPKSLAPGWQFGSVAAASPSRAAPAADSRAQQTPLQILSKPRPVYTDEARGLRIEGVVLLETWFGASGQIRILRVVRSLGHGLDQAATEAAQGIRFIPREQQGQPADTVAMVEITFRLAY